MLCLLLLDSSELILPLDVIYYVACVAGKMILNIPQNKHRSLLSLSYVGIISQLRPLFSLL
jgi:hypothetical protein